MKLKVVGQGVVGSETGTWTLSHIQYDLDESALGVWANLAEA
jgi:hypothetical protein